LVPDTTCFCIRLLPPYSEHLFNLYAVTSAPLARFFSMTAARSSFLGSYRNIFN